MTIEKVSPLNMQQSADCQNGRSGITLSVELWRTPERNYQMELSSRGKNGCLEQSKDESRQNRKQPKEVGSFCNEYVLLWVPRPDNATHSWRMPRRAKTYGAGPRIILHWCLGVDPVLERYAMMTLIVSFTIDINQSYYSTHSMIIHHCD